MTPPLKPVWSHVPDLAAYYCFRCVTCRGRIDPNKSTVFQRETMLVYHPECFTPSKDVSN